MGKVIEDYTKLIRFCIDHGSSLSHHKDFIFMQSALFNEIDTIEKDLQDILNTAQKYQPGGSPPPGGPAVLLAWILHELNAKANSLKETCNWKVIDPEYNEWGCDCGIKWHFLSGDPLTNKIKYCPVCGREIVVQPAEVDNA